jgi:hypothetical protein
MVAGALLASAPTALAAPTTSPASAACVKQHAGTTTTRVVADYIVKLRQEDKTQAEIDAALSTQFCWERLASPTAATGVAPNVVTPMGASGNGDVSVNTPVFYYDRNAHQWNVSMNWNWVNDSYAGQSQGNYNQSYHIGGPDGVGVSLSGGARITSPVAEYWGKGCYYKTATTGPSTADSYGVGFIMSDMAHYYADSWECSVGSNPWVDYNMEHGQVLFNVDNGGTCENIHAYGRYNHTWSSTSVNSVGVGPYSVVFGWNTTSNEWSWSSAGSAWAYVC